MSRFQTDGIQFVTLTVRWKPVGKPFYIRHKSQKRVYFRSARGSAYKIEESLYPELLRLS
jgi:hypothetical protein